MQQKTSASTKNRILSRLSAADMALLKPDLDLSNSHFGMCSKWRTSPSHTAISSSMGWLPLLPQTHKRMEVGLIGCEGMTGLPIVLGDDRSPNETFMQVAGDGRRIAADKLREAISQSRSLERALLGFAHVFMNQTASTALSNGTGTLEERLARWLLMANDRLGGDEVPLTHEFLSLMLGVRRAGVTVALHYLEHRALIRLARKQILIMDRKGLEAAANGTYHHPEKRH